MEKLLNFCLRHVCAVLWPQCVSTAQLYLIVDVLMTGVYCCTDVWYRHEKLVYFCSFRLCCTNMTNKRNTGVLFILLLFITGWRGISDEKEAILGNVLLPFTEIRWQQTSMEVEIKPNGSRLALTHSIIVSATEAFCSFRTLNGPTQSRLLHTPQQAGNVLLLLGPEAAVLCCSLLFSGVIDPKCWVGVVRMAIMMTFQLVLRFNQFSQLSFIFKSAL